MAERSLGTQYELRQEGRLKVTTYQPRHFARNLHCYIIGDTKLAPYLMNHVVGKAFNLNDARMVKLLLEYASNPLEYASNPYLCHLSSPYKLFGFGICTMYWRKENSIEIFRLSWGSGANIERLNRYEQEEFGMTYLGMTDTQGNCSMTSSHFGLNRCTVEHIDEQDVWGTTPLMMACQCGHLEIFRFMLDNGANVNHQNKFGMTGLSYASQQGSLEMTQRLLDQGANIHLQDNRGRTPLFFARQIAGIGSQLVAMVRCLLERGANVNHQDNKGRTPLFFMAGGNKLKGKHLERDDENLERDEEHSQQDKVYFEEYNYSVTLGEGIPSEANVEVIQLLLDRGANLQHQDVWGETPLFFSVRTGQIDITHLLLACGANVDHQNSVGRTPIYLAITKGDLEMVRLLMDKGANIYHQDNCGIRPLVMASQRSHWHVVHFMLKRGANTEYQDNNLTGRTLMQYALKECTVEEWRHEIIYLLVQAVAQQSAAVLSEQIAPLLQYALEECTVEEQRRTIVYLVVQAAAQESSAALFGQIKHLFLQR